MLVKLESIDLYGLLRVWHHTRLITINIHVRSYILKVFNYTDTHLSVQPFQPVQWI